MNLLREGGIVLQREGRVHVARRTLQPRNRVVDTRLHAEGNSNSHVARPVYYSHLKYRVDSDQKVVNKELFLATRGARPKCSPHSAGTLLDLIPASIHDEYDFSPGHWSLEPTS